jgi:iron complex transport system ATP-binding protein
MDMYRIDSLDYSISSKKILNNIEFCVKKGEMIGVLGPNGSGKSTLLKTILNYLKKDKGNIEIKGKDITCYKQKEIAKIVAFVPQKPKLNMSLSVYDFAMLGRIPHVKNSFSSYTKDDYEYVNKVLSKLKLEEFKDRDVQSLSGGEFQRVLLARALAQKPEVILLDEATSAMDLNYALKMMNITETLVKRHGLTAITVLHDLNLAALYCDKIVFLKEGKVRYFGEVKELFKESILEEIYGFKCNIIENFHGRPSIIPLKGV